MKLRVIFAALLFSVLFSAQFVTTGAQTSSSIPASGTAVELLMVVAENDQGAAFLRAAQPVLERLEGRVLSVKQVRNPGLGREETMIALSFASAEGANNFMMTLSGSQPGEDETSGSSHSCHQDGSKKVCYFYFGSYRFVCIKYDGAEGVCGQY